MEELITKVKVGDTVEIPQKRFGTVTVLPACSEKDNGYWYCATHKEAFDNQFQKDTHISDKRSHALAWVCWKHGFEQP